MDDLAPWWLAGPALGLLIVGLMATINGRLGVMGGVADALDTLRRRADLGWRSTFLLGTVLGGTAFALAGGRTAGDDAYAWWRDAAPAHADLAVLAALVGGGVLIGYGARTAGGCTSGNGLTGTSLGSLASVVASASFMAVAIGATLLLRWLVWS